MATSQSHGNSSSAPSALRERIVAGVPRVISRESVRSLSQVLCSDAQLHLVGGALRELALDLPVRDIDIATVLFPEIVAERLTAAGIRVVETGLKHGTVTAVFATEHIEITTFREPGPHGQNHYSSSIQEDLGGRDFTINALAWSLGEEKLVDPYGGVLDLASGVLRAVGDAESRLSEDPLRLLRAVRFGPAAGRAIDQVTSTAIAKLAPTLSSVSVERIRDEFVKILLSPAAAAGLRAMLALGLLERVVPEALESVGLEQNEFHTEDVFSHTLTVLERCELDALLRLTAFFHDLGKPATLTVDEEGRRHFYEHELKSAEIAKNAMQRLRFSHDDVDAVVSLVRLHMRPTNCGAPGVRRILRDAGAQYVRWRKFKFADKPPIFEDSQVGTQLEQFDQLVSSEQTRLAERGNRLCITGDDLKELGYQEGVQLGRVLKQLEEDIIEDPSRNTRAELLTRAKAALNGNK